MQIEQGKPSPAAKKGNLRRQPAGQAQSGDTDETDRLAAKLRALGPEAEQFARRLLIVNTFRMWVDCPDNACRRARACRADGMACFEERRDELKRKVLQEVVWLLCTAAISSDEFYDYLDEVTAGPEEDGGGPEAW